MHRTLKAETTHPPCGNLSSQQRRFNQFREEYNQQRPHEALNQETPASRYGSSPPKMPPKLPSIDYPAHYEVRLVSRNGGIHWNREWVNVTHTLGGEYVGLEEIDNDLWDVYFGPLRLGRFNERTLRIEDHLGRTQGRVKVSPMSPDQSVTDLPGCSARTWTPRTGTRGTRSMRKTPYRLSTTFPAGSRTSWTAAMSAGRRVPGAVTGVGWVRSSKYRAR